MEGAGCLPEETGRNRREDHQYLQSSILHREVSVGVEFDVDYYIRYVYFIAILNRIILTHILNVSPS